MATQGKTASEMISETARAEGGTDKGTASAQMQSQVTREQSFEQAAEQVAAKATQDPQSVTSEDAAYLKSREARATGQAQPPKDSVSADAQRLAAFNEGATKTSVASGSVDVDQDPAVQSAMDRVENFQQAKDDVVPKMATNPEEVTKEEADLLHSREQRAFGETAKGGLASQAQSQASENEKKGTI